MIRVRLSTSDVARLRITAGLGPVAESLFALELLHMPYGRGAGRWRRQVLGRLGPARRGLEILRRHAEAADLGWALSSSGPEADERGPIRAALLEFGRVAVLPYWVAVQDLLADEREAMLGPLRAGGGEALLAGAHPGIRWRAPILEIDSPTDERIDLDGRGLDLVPSAFLPRAGHALALSGPGPAVLAYPTRRGVDSVLARDDHPSSDDGDRAVSALLGATRTAALRVLTGTCSTGALADRLGISVAGASKHATVLRQAGLIATTRDRNTALHTVTALGIALLRRGGEVTVPVRASGTDSVGLEFRSWPKRVVGDAGAEHTRGEPEVRTRVR